MEAGGYVSEGMSDVGGTLRIQMSNFKRSGASA